jgi:hypothetical protein
MGASGEKPKDVVGKGACSARPSVMVPRNFDRRNLTTTTSKVGTMIKDTVS